MKPQKLLKKTNTKPSIKQENVIEQDFSNLTSLKEARILLQDTTKAKGKMESQFQGLNAQISELKDAIIGKDNEINKLTDQNEDRKKRAIELVETLRTLTLDKNNIKADHMALTEKLRMTQE